jgi:hypothetical protein
MNQAALQQSINQQAQAQAQQQHQAQMMMNQNSMQGQQRAMGQQPAQQGFQHLQHQMQASPLPGQQLASAKHGPEPTATAIPNGYASTATAKWLK